MPPSSESSIQRYRIRQIPYDAGCVRRGYPKEQAEPFPFLHPTNGKSSVKQQVEGQPVAEPVSREGQLSLLVYINRRGRIRPTPQSQPAMFSLSWFSFVSLRVKLLVSGRKDKLLSKMCHQETPDSGQKGYICFTKKN